MDVQLTNITTTHQGEKLIFHMQMVSSFITHLLTEPKIPPSAPYFCFTASTHLKVSSN